MKSFLDQDFMLHSDAARELYHDHAASMPIFDYHCHLPPAEIASNKQFRNMTEIWLKGDHYKWRAMRTNGVDERLVTGSAGDREKFQAWAETVPATIGNPLYHWTHLELKSPFGISDTVLNGDTAEDIWNRTSGMLSEPEYSARGILEQMNVRFVCTTDDPADDLQHHTAMAKDKTLKTRVLPAFRPDKALSADAGPGFTEYLEKLGAAAGIEINSFKAWRDAMRARLEYFHSLGARISDHALVAPVAEFTEEAEIERIFQKALKGQTLSQAEAAAFRTEGLLFLGREYATRGWTMQLHIGALRNNNTRMFERLGPDTGFDSMADQSIARPLSLFLDRLDVENLLPRTILYVLNPRDNDVAATMIGNFQDGTVPGKMQFGSGWWFNDQKDGMERQMTVLANMGLLSRFVGMLTDSRSFLSYPRHEYFRRILCNMIGSWVENGEAPADMKLLGKMVEDISWNNAVNYFGIEV